MAEPAHESCGAFSTDDVEFTDAANVFWRVSERNCSGEPGCRGERCLIFSSADTIRRVWQYPVEWRSLSADALIALSWTR